ncbi:MAG: GTP-binding protein [Pseudomonadota bacterium]
MIPRRNRFGERLHGAVMHPIQISLVVGRKGSGVSTLLDAFSRRADVENTTIIDGLAGLTETWDAATIAAWLKQAQPNTSHVVLAANDPKAPRLLLQALTGDPAWGSTFRLSSVTAVASALTLTEAAGCVCAGSDGTAEREEARGSKLVADPKLHRFFATADRLILTHTDRVRPDAVTQLAKQLKALNPPAPILRGRNGDIGPARLVDSGLFDPVDGSIDIDRWLCEAAFGFEASRRGVSAPKLGEVQSTLGRSAGGVQSFAVTIDQPLDSTVLSVFLKLLMADRGADLLRLKGIVAIEDHPDRPALIDGREHLIQPLLWLPAWPTADRRGRLVFTTADTTEAWIRTLLTTLSDQLKLQAMPELQMAMVREVG